MEIYQQGYQQRREDHHNRFLMGAKIFVIFGVPIIALLMILFVFRLYYIKGPSMEPALHNSNRVVIEKPDLTTSKS